MNNPRFEIITDVEKAKEIWNLLSPHKTIDDEWDFRYEFFRSLPYQLEFIVAFHNDGPVALLPLQKNNLEGLMPPYYLNDGKPFLEFFGGDDTDDNEILGDKNLIRELLFQVKEKAYLAPLASSFESFPNTVHYENKYFVDLSSYESYEDFLQEKWGGDSRRKILQQVRKLNSEHKVEILENNFDDIELLAEFNKNRFGDRSSFSYPYRKEIFGGLTKLYEVVMLTLVVDGEKSAVSYGIKYKDAYVGMNAGVSSQIPDLPKFLILLQINKGIELGCKVYDGGKGDSGWKESFHFSKIPQFKIVLNP